MVKLEDIELEQKVEDVTEAKDATEEIASESTPVGESTPAPESTFTSSTPAVDPITVISENISTVKSELAAESSTEVSSKTC